MWTSGRALEVFTPAGYGGFHGETGFATSRGCAVFFRSTGEVLVSREICDSTGKPQVPSARSGQALRLRLTQRTRQTPLRMTYLSQRISHLPRYVSIQPRACFRWCRARLYEQDTGILPLRLALLAQGQNDGLKCLQQSGKCSSERGSA